MVTDKDLERLKEIGFKLGAFELAAKEHPEIPVGMVKVTIDKAWSATFGEDNEQ